MGRPPAKDLTERELEVMHVFWSQGEATAAEARDRLAATGLDRTYTTIANLVRALHEKGFLRQVNAERPFVYRAARSYEDVSGRLLGDLVQRGLPRVARATALPPGRAAQADGRGAGAPRTDPEGAGPMNDLGLTLAWLAVQVGLLLVPALAVHALASRRGPARGAWVAALSLGLVVALSVAGLVPRSRGNDEARLEASARLRRGWPAAEPALPIRRGLDRVPVRTRVWQTRLGTRGSAVGLGAARARGGRAGGAIPALGDKPGGRRPGRDRASDCSGCCSASGPSASAAAAVRRSTTRRLTALLDELRCAMGCRRRVELREVPDLTTPATAGWRRPVVLLPDDWRSWDDAERRAVLAHELAHIVRGDYATGLMARLAVVLHAYHPLVRWMAGRLQMQQELAADALGARFAGGPTRYLVALSRLALRQDGRSPCWPARAFLPAQGTLIRRIAMLRQDTEARDRTWSRSRRVFVGLGLMGIAIGVAMLRGPAWVPALEPPADAPGAAVPAARTGERDRGRGRSSLSTFRRTPLAWSSSAPRRSFGARAWRSGRS